MRTQRKDPSKAVQIPAGDHLLRGRWYGVEEQMEELLVLSYLQGCSNLDPHAREFAGALEKRGHSVLLVELNPTQEYASYRHRLDPQLLGKRMGDVRRWLSCERDIQGGQVIYLCVGSGSNVVMDTVLRSGETPAGICFWGVGGSLPLKQLEWLRCPVLFVNGTELPDALTMAGKAYQRIRSRKKFIVFPDTTCLEPNQEIVDLVSNQVDRWIDSRIERVHMKN